MNKFLENTQWIEQAANAVREKLAWVSERSADKIPYTAVNGIHDDKSDPTGDFGPDDGINWWCNGFWPGMMWQMYSETGEQRYAQIARRAEQKLDQRRSRLSPDRGRGRSAAWPARRKSSGGPVQPGRQLPAGME